MEHSMKPFAETSGLQCEDLNCTNSSDVSIYRCLSCGSTYCDLCWDRQGPHRPGKTGADGWPHEKTDEAIYKRLRAILEPPSNVQELIQLHIEDEDTTWFGIEKDSSGQPIFQDHGRYAALMAETRQPGANVRYPQLVSFVGQTGAGKSTLIKMLVSLRERKLTLGNSVLFKSPVVGSTKNDKSPTSGDVHLYIDPGTAYLPLPMLYADCEGLEGGDTPPVANKSKETSKTLGPAAQVRQIFRTRPRELTYAKNNSEARNREWAVRKVYPRLLYTFSDVVVFVLRNTRAFESSALKLLIEWASTSLESSINQPALPHAIIVLNATSMDIDMDEWDTEVATARLMAHIANAVKDVDFFRRYADHWRKRHKPIDNTLDLIRCYYSDITVIRVPTKGRYMLVNDQINKLHNEIIKNCDASFTSKGNAHMLSNTDELNSYLQAGFDHFTTEEDKPFDFVQVALKNNPIPRDFGDHILGLAAKIRQVTGETDGVSLFNKLSFMVASCIFVDCIRQHRPGKSQHLFDQFYSSSCIASLEHFCNKFWPCNYVSKKGVKCANVKATHDAKGHQTVHGRIISSGPYQSQFSSFKYGSAWTTQIKEHLISFERRLEDCVAKERPRPRGNINPKDVLPYEIHRDNMHTFFEGWENFNADKFTSPTTCFCCLMEVPQHPLPCGHILCTECIKAYGKKFDQNCSTIDGCPLRRGVPFQSAYNIYFKPDFAGIRVLTLDGGGIRGIVELEVLREIESALGGRISLLAFFDLIVGTSTGGIIALGLGVKQWSLDQCISEFIRLCEKAFTPRELQAAGLRQMVTLRHGSKYKTRPFHNALRTVFENEELYGGCKPGHKFFDTKVAVTSTTGTGTKAVLLANYSRQEENEPNYKFEFPHNLKVWEAARATSAAPSFFKPYRTIEGYKTYLDGAIYYNNPVRVANQERKYLWPDVAENAPDIILSVGTGKNGRLMEEELSKERGEKTLVRESKPKSSGTWSRLGERLKSNKPKKTKPFGLVSRYFDVLVNRIDKILDTEREWESFYFETQNSEKSTDSGSRCFRVNLDLRKNPPPLDAYQELSGLQSQVIQILRTREYQNYIEQIAHRLIASTFYFVKVSVGPNETGTFNCSGRIACRFEGNSTEMRNNMRELGTLLRQQQAPGYQPYFTVKEKFDHPDSHKVYITETMIEDMIRRAEFRIEDTLEIEISSQLTPTSIYLALYERQSPDPVLYPLSGFPRHLVMEDALNATRLDKRAELIRQRRFGTLDVANDPKVVNRHDDTLSKTDSADSDAWETNTLTESNSADTSATILSEKRGSTQNGLEKTKQDSALRSHSLSDVSNGAHDDKALGGELSPTPSHAVSVDRAELTNRPKGFRSQNRSSLPDLNTEPKFSMTELRAKVQEATNTEAVVVDAIELEASYPGAPGGIMAGLLESDDSDGPASDDG